MSERRVSVTLKLDTTAFTNAMRKVAAALQRLSLAFQTAEQRHRLRHHRREVPQISAMHAAYDRRRRARRRKR
ncbi:hypothetical protein JCM18899A_18620 [Nocardioides sp. AN3]